MNKRPPIIAVRPRKGSDLEAQQQALNNDMADILHSWASTFKLMTEQSKLAAFAIKEQSKGETDQ